MYTAVRKERHDLDLAPLAAAAVVHLLDFRLARREAVCFQHGKQLFRVAAQIRQHAPDAAAFALAPACQKDRLADKITRQHFVV